MRLSSIGWMDITIRSFIIFLLQYRKTNVGQNERLALPIWHLVGLSARYAHYLSMEQAANTAEAAAVSHYFSLPTHVLFHFVYKHWNTD